jgi:hypothetical protein
LGGWAWLMFALFVVLPFLGVISPLTRHAVIAGWVCAIGLPVVAAADCARLRLWRVVTAFGVVAVVALVGLLGTGVPQTSPEKIFAQHRRELAGLAAEYRAGRLGSDADLPWRLRFVSIDGQAHKRCGEPCALYLPLWQNWRHENGGGIAYYPEPPVDREGRNPAIATAEGDAAGPRQELGDGWWVVE